MLPAEILADLHDPRLILSDHYVGRDRRRIGSPRELPPLAAPAPTSSPAVAGGPEESPLSPLGAVARSKRSGVAWRRARDVLAILTIAVATVFSLALIGSHAGVQAASSGHHQRKAATAASSTIRAGKGQRVVRAGRIRSTSSDRGTGHAVSASNAAHGATHPAGPHHGAAAGRTAGAYHPVGPHHTAVELSAGLCATGQTPVSDAGCRPLAGAVAAAARHQKAALRLQARAARRAESAVLRTERRASHSHLPGVGRSPKA